MSLTCLLGRQKSLESATRVDPSSGIRLEYVLGRAAQKGLLTMTWSHPDRCNILATNFAVIGARLRSFLSCLAYGKSGMTAVIRFALAILQAWIIMHSSISAVLIAPHPVFII